MKHKTIKTGKVISNKRCPRCGSIMAKHKDRWYCGKCHYTEFITNEK